MATKKAILDIAQKLNITARKGDTLRLQVTFTDSGGTPINVDQYTYRLQVRPSAFDNAEPGAILDISGDATLGGSGFEIGDGNVTIHILSGTMAGINGGSYVYDLEAKNITDTTLIQTWLKGSFVVNEDVTVNA